MSSNTKFLPVLALAAALGPFVASARSDRAPVQNRAHQQTLVGAFGATQAAANLHGRAAEANPPAGLFIMDSTPQYTAASTAADEN